MSVDISPYEGENARIKLLYNFQLLATFVQCCFPSGEGVEALDISADSHIFCFHFPALQIRASIFSLLLIILSFTHSRIFIKLKFKLITNRRYCFKNCKLHCLCYVRIFFALLKIYKIGIFATINIIHRKNPTRLKFLSFFPLPC